MLVDKDFFLIYQFQSTRSARSATTRSILILVRHQNFNPRAPRGARPDYIRMTLTAKKISIHALREERDSQGLASGVLRGISIHALREERDFTVVVC